MLKQTDQTHQLVFVEKPITAIDRNHKNQVYTVTDQMVRYRKSPFNSMVLNIVLGRQRHRKLRSDLVKAQSRWAGRVSSWVLVLYWLCPIASHEYNTWSFGTQRSNIQDSLVHISGVVERMVVLPGWTNNDSRKWLFLPILAVGLWVLQMAIHQTWRHARRLLEK
jgi:hypothetical protein